MYKILIVEDDRTIAQSLTAKHLEKWDYTVCTVQDFHNVMEEFVSFGPELVLMDILLPFFS